MEFDVQKLKEELDRAVLEMPLSSDAILELSMRLDKLIIQYYK